MTEPANTRAGRAEMAYQAAANKDMGAFWYLDVEALIDAKRLASQRALSDNPETVAETWKASRYLDRVLKGTTHNEAHPI